MGATEGESRQGGEDYGKDSEQADGQGYVRHGFLKDVEGIVAGICRFGVHDREQVEHIKGARLLQRNEEVQHEVDSHSAQGCHKSQGVLLDEHRQKHNEGAESEQHQNLDQHRHG